MKQDHCSPGLKYLSDCDEILSLMYGSLMFNLVRMSRDHIVHTVLFEAFSIHVNLEMSE